MTPGFFLLLFIPLALAAFFYPAARRRMTLAAPFPDSWLAIIKRRLPFYEKLTTDEQRQLKDNIKLFVAGKRFHGCGGLEINDDIRITIAAEACLLLLNRKTGNYPGLKHILVYPAAFVASRTVGNEDGTHGEHAHGLLGESWQAGKVVLSWEDVEHGAANIHDGRNVAFHEFSHQLDSESGSANGAPPLRSARYPRWASVLSEEFGHLKEKLHRHKPSVMDYYGATNPAEFFAVATETFFEKPVQMKKQHPELYDELQQYYQVHPENWQ